MLGVNFKNVLILRRMSDWWLIVICVDFYDLGWVRGVLCDDIWLYDFDIVIVFCLWIECLVELVEFYFM